MSAHSISDIIDLEHYPVNKPDSPRLKEIIKQGRKALDEQALFSLEAFIKPEVIEEMAGELESLLNFSCRFDQRRDAYDYGDEKQIWPAGHPRNQLHACRYNQVLNYQIPNDSLLRQVYYWQPLTEFLRILCGYQSFYRSDCPHLSLTSKIAGEGDTDGWHFDTNDVVFSILLQAPEAGGEFEYAPYVRTEKEENYDSVAALLKNPDNIAIKPPMAVGNLTVFKGDLSMHRVTPVSGNRKRIVGLFCYDQKPGTTFSQSYINDVNQGLPG